MADKNTLLEKLDGLSARFEEISTLIADPNVIADQKRYVKLTKEYKDLERLMGGNWFKVSLDTNAVVLQLDGTKKKKISIAQIVNRRLKIAIQ